MRILPCKKRERKKGHRAKTCHAFNLMSFLLDRVLGGVRYASDANLKKTVVHAEHVKVGGTMVDFAGPTLFYFSDD